MGEQIRELIEVDTSEDGTTLGQCLRVKVKMKVAEPLMRGMYLDDEEDEEDEDGDAVVGEFGKKKDEEEEKNWCHFQYKFLPDFCCTCGRMGHIDRGGRRIWEMA